METWDLKKSQDLARRLRTRTVTMIHVARASHLGSCLSMADILAVLFSDVLRLDPGKPKWPGRDRLLLSKGHAAAIYYAALAEAGFFPEEELGTFCRPGSVLTGHINSKVKGVELATGSLGHALPVACGMALAERRTRVFALLSDGELDEGSNWESILFAGHHGLDNLTAIIDYNGIQSFGTVAEVLALEPLAQKWTAFSWHTLEIDGHDLRPLYSALSTVPQTKGKPTVVIAKTIKGKGVSFMEGKLAWHYASPTKDQMQQALEELSRS